MANKIVFASSNQHKIKEVKSKLESFEVISLKDIGFYDEIEENGTTFEENAMIKAKAIHEFLKNQNLEYDVLADDAGLCVNALEGEPGVYSARYCGDHDDIANRKKLLENLKDKEDRSAYFCCALAFIFANGEHLISIGKTYGDITTEEIGDKSFGYDCLFYSHDLQKTFGEASMEDKNQVSHRGRALENLVKQLNSLK